MGPITKKLKKLSQSGELSPEVIKFIKSITDDISNLESSSINQAYDSGHFDCEKGRRSANYFNVKYFDFSKIIEN